MKSRRIRAPWITVGLLSAGALAALLYVTTFATQKQPSDAMLKTSSSSQNPLANAKLYNDRNRPLAILPTDLLHTNRHADAEAVKKIAAQPGATWLVGPSESDPTAERDLAAVSLVSQAAAQEKSMPVFVLYAIPERDACADFSKGGFADSSAYSQWIRSIAQLQQTPAVYIIEPDAIAQAVETSCLSAEQRTERFQTIRSAVEVLAASDITAAAYIDAGHVEWTSDPRKLVEPLQASGIDAARGISVNVSFFAPTDQSAAWAQKLTAYLRDDKGIVIDTSRNGNGLPPSDQTGVARWCNPKGRAVGNNPTVKTGNRGIDAYLWIKNVGESDGDCFGNPPAGTFMPEAVIDFAKNARSR